MRTNVIRTIGFGLVAALCTGCDPVSGTTVAEAPTEEFTNPIAIPEFDPQPGERIASDQALDEKCVRQVSLLSPDITFVDKVTTTTTEGELIWRADVAWHGQAGRFVCWIPSEVETTVAFLNSKMREPGDRSLIP